MTTTTLCGKSPAAIPLTSSVVKTAAAGMRERPLSTISLAIYSWFGLAGRRCAEDARVLLQMAADYDDVLVAADWSLAADGSDFVCVWTPSLKNQRPLRIHKNVFRSLALRWWWVAVKERPSFLSVKLAPVEEVAVGRLLRSAYGIDFLAPMQSELMWNS